MVIHQRRAQVCFFQSTVQHNAGCDPSQFYYRGSNHERDIPRTRQRDERLRINTSRIGDCASGRGDCHIRYIVLVPERKAPEVHCKGTVRVSPEYLLKRDLVGDPGVVVPASPVGKGDCSTAFQP